MDMRKKLFEFGKKTEIYSDVNSVGKSTLLRLLFYAMGYSIPSTKKLDFQSLQNKIKSIETDQLVTLQRKK